MSRVLVGAAVTALVAGLLTPAAANAAPEGGSDVTALTGPGGRQWTVTLITGDTVRLSQDGSGRYTATPQAVRRPDGSTPNFRSEASPEGIFVIPDDARPAIEAGVLERRLFDVRYLAANGFADDADKQLPLIVQYQGSAPQASIAATAQALPASTAERSLPSIHGAAVAVDKASATDFWSTLRGQSAATPDKQLKSLTGGIGKVWLDRKVKADLAESVPLIGAPEAWKAGFDGSGTTVAVLDTGVDAAHPDVAGKIVTSRSFVPGEEVADGHGHGTHVAATVAGSGAASGGSRKGVAPGAQLAIGKVLDNKGSGESSAIIAGMEWAVGEAKAKIVSMSIGGDPSDGTDVLSQAVDELSKSSGALFVIAAGNAGPDTETVGMPGSAASALTVAATDKSDGLAEFSSRGPRVNDGALKPDIAAPGVDIIAARAAGTTLGTPVDDLYTSLSGTSMATPHVAGAAAILAQEHPDWRGERLKAALMSTAKDAGHTAYQQGAGRVDVARAVSQKVTATTPNADFGYIAVDKNDTVDRTVTYANDGDAEVTLTLDATMKDTADTLTLSAPTVTVPAGGTAEVTVTLHPDGLVKGAYTGALVATDAAGVRVTTPIGLVRGPKRVPLTVRAINRNGQAPGPMEFFTGASAVDVPGVYGVRGANYLGDGAYQYMVEPGTYSVSAGIVHQSPDGAAGPNATLLNPEVVVPESGLEVTLDARKAVLLRYDTPKPIDRRHAVGAITTVRTAWDGSPVTAGEMGLITIGDRYVSPTQKVTKGKFLFSTRLTAINEQVAVRAVAPQKYSIASVTNEYFDKGQSLGPEDVPFPAGLSRHKLAYVGAASPEEIAATDLRGKLALLAVGPTGYCEIPIDRVQQLKAAGAVGIVLFADDSVTPCQTPVSNHGAGKTELPVAQITRTAAGKLRTQLARGPVTLEITSTPDIDYTYQLQEYEEGKIPGDLTYRYSQNRLRTVDTDFHTPDGPGLQTETWHSFKPLEKTSFSVAFGFTGPAQRPEYFSGFSADTLRLGIVNTGGGEDLKIATAIEKPGRETRNWGSGVFTPGSLIMPSLGSGYRLECPMCRAGDIFMASYSLVNGNGEQGREDTYANALAKLSKDGKELPRYQGSIYPLYNLPKEEGVYRLEQSGRGNTNVWTFRSKGRDKATVTDTHTCVLLPQLTGPCGPQPLVFVGYDLGETQALDNSVQAGRRHTFDIDVSHAPSTEKLPAIAGLKLSYSTDDGQTWKSATVKKGRDGVYTTTLTYPALAQTKGAVSLKAEAWDTGGNKVEQTTARAFTLR
ncbi:S8 family peptidase [Nonomuraea zeae]|uniref:Serine protease n=1 Tax=Nonomuraea zeae TaxID=1642303 RepID=A0A5S4G8N8_9ACTN|nr:S8 family serine peptidase [Nonomuraea zeae]TMR29388.1 serine protease [Nonomuraea zeae]